MFEGMGLLTKGRQAAPAIQASEQTGSSVSQEMGEHYMKCSRKLALKSNGFKYSWFDKSPRKMKSLGSPLSWKTR